MIGTYRESSLHVGLKDWYKLPGDLIEQRVGNYVVDIVRDGLLVEIQTGGFSGLKKKLGVLLDEFPIRVVYPVPFERWIIKQGVLDGGTGSRRKSPKKGTVYDAFRELVYIADSLAHPRFSLEILLIQEEVTWLQDGRGSWRRKGWSIADRHLKGVVSKLNFQSQHDYKALLPSSLPELFSAKEISKQLRIPPSLARKMVYCLRTLEIIRREPFKQKTGHLYRMV
jgi:hypothetical protein